MNQKTLTPQPITQWMQQGNRSVILIIVLLIVAVLAIAAMNQSPHRQMCCLFDDYNLTKNERQKVLLALGESGLAEYELENGQILVPEQDQAKYLAAVKDKKALPLIFDIEKEFQPNPFMPRSQQALLEKDRKKKYIRGMILQLRFVAEAWIEMDWSASRALFEPDRRTAVVMVRPKGQAAITIQQVECIQQLVSSANAGIGRENVAVVDSNLGIAYQDIRDPDQSNLINFMKWKMNRRDHYLDQLAELVNKYPGLEIDVDVDRLDGAIQVHPQDQIASEPSEKLAFFKPIANANTGDPTRVGLNSPASVPCESAKPHLNDKQVDGHANFASYQEPVEKTPSSRLPSSHDITPHRLARKPSTINESVKVTIRVPHSALAGVELPESGGADTAASRFEVLKSELVAKIRKIIPATSLATAQPISVVMIPDHSMANSANSQFKSATEIFERVWPVCAVVLIGLSGVIWLRTQNRPPINHVSESNATTADNDESQLKNQLSELIDSDPATAAKVLKNWIRQTH